jgi:hypothetical protein
MSTEGDAHFSKIQGVIEMRDQIPTTSYWPHAELGKNIQKIPSKNKMTFVIGLHFF